MKRYMCRSWNGIPDARTVDFVRGVAIVAPRMTLFSIPEPGKPALRKWRRKHDGSRGSPDRSEAGS